MDGRTGSTGISFADAISSWGGKPVSLLVAGFILLTHCSSAFRKEEAYYRSTWSTPSSFPITSRSLRRSRSSPTLGKAKFPPRGEFSAV